MEPEVPDALGRAANALAERRGRIATDRVEDRIGTGPLSTLDPRPITA